MTSPFDVVVVGGGTAGCVVAARLSEEPERSVCLVEAGPDYGPYDGGAWPDDLLDARRLAFSHSWETEHEDRSQLRARVLGGCSAHNACVVLEGDPSEYDAWGEGWSYELLRPYFERARHMLRTRRFGTEELSPWHRAFAAAAGDEAILHPVNAVGTVRWNAAFAYLDPARSRRNLTIFADTLVDRVMDDGRVVTAQEEMRGRTIVLCAGAYGTPAVLLRSGLAPELPVGEGLTDHVGVGLAWEGREGLQRETDAFAAEHPVYMGQVTVRSEDGELFLFPALDPGWEISAAVFAMKPRSRGRVSLTSTDPRAPLRIEHGFLSDPRDEDVLVKGVEALRALVASDTVQRYAAREARPGADIPPRDHVRATARGFFHPTGTCAMGRVVDGRGRVIGAEHVIVADASMMPVIPSVNTNLTVAAVAERIAETLD